jgi:hypothetical protein
LIDPSITEYVVETPGLKEQLHLFLSLSEGSTIRVDEGMARSFVSLCGELDNPELCIPLLKHFQSDIGLDQIYTFGDESLLDSIASQFSKFSRSDLDNIPLPALYHILSSDSLVVESEDWLYDYISGRFSTDAEFSEWIRFVQFRYLSDECIESFTSMIPEYIDRRLWEPLSRRLMIGCRGGTPFPVTRVRPVAPYNPLDDPPDYQLSPGGGIIAYLTRLHDQNLHDKGIVTVTSKSLDEGNLGQVVDFSLGEVRTKGEADSWICWNFHNLVVFPTHYYVKSRSLYSWVVESSLDGENWVDIDRRIEQDADDTLDLALEVSNANECRFIRLTQITGKPSRSGIEFHNSDPELAVLAGFTPWDETPRRDYPLRLRCFDVFGRLREC